MGRLKVYWSGQNTVSIKHEDIKILPQRNKMVYIKPPAFILRVRDGRLPTGLTVQFYRALIAGELPVCCHKNLSMARLTWPREWPV